MIRSIAIALVCVCAAACARRGKVPKLSGAAWVQLFAQYDRAVSDARVDDLDNRAMIGASARGLLGKHLAYCAGFDAAFGGSEGAFAYEANLYAVGGGVRLGRVGHVAVCGGAGFSGAAGALPFAWQLPVDVSLSFNLGRRLRPLVWARAVWLLSDSRRDGGSPSLDTIDEGTLSVGLRIGKRRRYGRIHTGNGTFVGVRWSELGGARFIGLTIAHGINAGN